MMLGSMLCSAERFHLALDKIRPRFKCFQQAGWSTADLTSCARTRYGHHGLALFLRPEQDLGRIWEWCAEILGSTTRANQRSRLLYWRSGPLCQLLATVGSEVVPPEVAEEWRVWKL